MCLHFLHMYVLSPSYILVDPDRITVPLSVRRIPWCFTLTRPILGNVSKNILNSIIKKSFKTKTTNANSKERNKQAEHMNRNKPGHSSGEPPMLIRTQMNFFSTPFSENFNLSNIIFYIHSSIIPKSKSSTINLD